jgi:transposase-like protein
MGDFVKHPGLFGNPRCPQCETSILVTFNPDPGPFWLCTGCHLTFSTNFNRVVNVVDRHGRI